MIHKEDAPEFIFYDDVKACYANIQHDWLIAHAPMNKQVLSKFLSAGIVFDGELFPSTGTGISGGLAFSEEKTKICPVTEPFTFLSRTYIKKSAGLIAQPFSYQ